MSDRPGGVPDVPPPYRIIRHDILGSTNDEAARLARVGAAEGTIVWAQEQTAGRGRLGRQWVSHRGNLFVSLILRPEIPAARASELGFVAALAVAEAIRGLLPADIGIELKWPNDILADGRKVAGILLEASSRADRLEWIVVGIGVNLASAPESALFPATCIADFVAPPDCSGALGRLVAAFSDQASRWRDLGFAYTRAAWLEMAWRRGQMMTVKSGEQCTTGRFVELGHDGSMILGTEAGNRQLSVGEIAFGGA